MNLSELWSGTDYAHTDSISRGVLFYQNAKRVRIIRTYKERPYGAERATGMAEVFYLKDDGTNIKTYTGEDMIRRVRARDIFMRWDEYERERQHRIDAREQIAKREAEEQAKREESKTILINALEKRLGDGFNRLWISSVGDHAISLNRRSIEEWLGVNNGPVEGTVGQ